MFGAGGPGVPPRYEQNRSSPSFFAHQTDIRGKRAGCIEAGTDALAVINTSWAWPSTLHSRRPIIGNIQGGLSGPAIKRSHF